MTRDFAPISGDQSIQVRLASSWLTLNAILTLALAAFAVGTGLLAPDGVGAGMLRRPLTIVILVLWGLGAFKAGRALSRRSMLAGYSAIFLYALPLLLIPIGGWPTVEVIGISVLGIIAIATAWGYLQSSTSAFSISTDVNAPPSVVWEVMRDGARWPEWTSSVTSVKLLDPEPLALGSRVLIRQPGFPPALWKVTELEEGKAFTWVSRAPGIEVTARHGVAALPSGTRATLSIAFHGPLGPLLGWMTRKVNVRYLALEATGLKQRSESC